MTAAPRGIPRALILWIGAIFFVMTAGAVARMTLWTYGADTGTFVQLILDTFGGMRDTIEHGTHFRYHWSPTLALLWPLLALTHSALALQIVQIAATLTVAPLLYLLVEPRAGTRLALRVAILALLYPPLLAMAWNEFHELGLFAPLAVGAIVAADRRAWVWFAICILLAIGLREDICIEIVIAGSALAIAGWRSRLAWSLAAAAALVSVGTYYLIIVPPLGAWVPGHFYVYPFATGPLALVLAPILHPAAFVATFVTRGRLTYLLEAFVPLALLPLRSRWSLLALPGFAIVLLSNDELTYHMGNHYAALWSPWLLIGAALAAARIGSQRWVDVAIGISALVLVAFNPMHPAHFLTANYHDQAAARAALACVPPNASVATHDEWFTQIAARNPHATLGTIAGVRYLVFADDYPNAEFARTVLPRLRAEVRAGSLRTVCRFGSVTAYARTAPG